MAVPRNRHSKARRNSKRAHHAKTPRQTQDCKNCGKPSLSHRMCGACGFYSGKSVIALEESK